MHRKYQKTFYRSNSKPNQENIDSAEIKQNNYVSINHANFNLAFQQASEKKLELFLKRAALFGAVATKTLPLWMTVFLLIDIVYSEEVKINSADNVNPDQNQGCPLTKRAAFFSGETGKHVGPVKNPVAIDPAVFKSFPGCSKSEVKNYVNKVVKESVETSAFDDEIKNEDNLKKAKVIFTANPSNFFPPDVRGEADVAKMEISEAVSHSSLVSDRVEHFNMMMTLRHEWHHLLEANKNLKWIPCIDPKLFKNNFWLGSPFIPSDSPSYMKAWADSIKPGLKRLESGQVLGELMLLYAPRIWFMDLFSNVSPDTIEKDILEKKYSNIVMRTTESSQFKELAEVFSPKGIEFNLYVYHIERRPNDLPKIWYGVVRNPNDITPGRLLFALIWDIKSRIFQYQIDPKAGSQGYAYNIAEIDAFFGGLHRNIIHGVFPEWYAFHKNLFAEAKRCSLPPIVVNKDKDGTIRFTQRRNEL